MGAGLDALRARARVRSQLHLSRAGGAQAPRSKTSASWRELIEAELVPIAAVDHRIPRNGDPVLLYDWDTLQSMTQACHDLKTAARDGGFGSPVRLRSG